MVGGWQLGKAGGWLAAVAGSWPCVWGGDAQPCVQFPTGLTIRHRRCELPGLTYFPTLGQLWPGVGPVERLIVPSPGTSPTDLVGSQSGDPGIGLRLLGAHPWARGWPFGQASFSSWTSVSIPGSIWRKGLETEFPPWYPGSWWAGAGEGLWEGLGCCPLHPLLPAESRMVP